APTKRLSKRVGQLTCCDCLNIVAIGSIRRVGATEHFDERIQVQHKPDRWFSPAKIGGQSIVTTSAANTVANTTYVHLEAEPGVVIETRDIGKVNFKRFLQTK